MAQTNAPPYSNGPSNRRLQRAAGQTRSIRGRHVHQRTTTAGPTTLGSSPSIPAATPIQPVRDSAMRSSVTSAPTPKDRKTRSVTSGSISTRRSHRTTGGCGRISASSSACAAQRRSEAESNYNGLQLYATKRQGDFSFTVGYTLSKVLPNASGFGDDAEGMNLDAELARGGQRLDRPALGVGLDDRTRRGRSCTWLPIRASSRKSRA